MRVLHLATSSQGGAGIAAERIVQAQKEFGIVSNLLTRENQSKNIRIFLATIIGKLVTLGSSFLARPKYGFISPISVSTVSLKDVENFGPDVINIHNWYNFLSFRDIQKLSKRYPLVFTLHDSRLASGGCHYTFDCRNFEQGCLKCPASKSDSLIAYSKKELDKALESLKSFSIVTPSKWLMDEIKHSSIFRESSEQMVIGNPINRNRNLRTLTSLSSPIQMCFISATLEAEYKGLPMLKIALCKLAQDNPNLKVEVNLVGFSRSNHDWESGGVRVKSLGSLESNQVRVLLESSDLLLVPSQLDNYPSVITEAQLAGVLVVATRVGGIPEMIKDGVDGFLSENSPEDFLKGILRAISTSDVNKFRLSVIDSVEKRVANSEIAEKYLQVYENLLKK